MFDPNWVGSRADNRDGAILRVSHRDFADLLICKIKNFCHGIPTMFAVLPIVAAADYDVT